MKTRKLRNLFKVTNKVMDVISVSLFLTYSIQCSTVSIVDFKLVNTSRIYTKHVTICFGVLL